MERVQFHDNSDAASVYSASSQSYFDSQSVNSQGGTPGRGVKGMRKKVKGIFRKNRYTSLSPKSPKRGEEVAGTPPLIPTQELLSPDSRPPLPSSVAARRRSLARQKGSTVRETRRDATEKDGAFGSEDTKWDPSKVLFDNVSISDITVKAQNPVKIRSVLRDSSKPVQQSKMQIYALLVALSVLFTLSCEIRLRGALFHPGGLRVLYEELTGGASIMAVFARELATLVTSTLIALATIVCVICSLEDS